MDNEEKSIKKRQFWRRRFIDDEASWTFRSADYECQKNRLPPFRPIVQSGQIDQTLHVQWQEDDFQWNLHLRRRLAIGLAPPEDASHMCIRHCFGSAIYFLSSSNEHFMGARLATLLNHQFADHCTKRKREFLWFIVNSQHWFKYYLWDVNRGACA